jgi:hypothetical protein
MAMLKRVFWALLAWLGVPGDFHWWWTVGFPVVGAVMVDVVLVYIREAPFWQLMSAFVIVCILLFVIASWWRKPRTSTANSPSTTYNIENVSIGAERQESDEEQAQEQWRQRIENWEAVVLDFDFQNGNFASTGTYFDMEDYLRPEVVEMFSKPRTAYVPNKAHGDSAHRTALLREIARIKTERGVV